jgi:hypothetical protein
MTAEVVPYRMAGGHRTKRQRQAECLEVLRLKRLGWIDSQIGNQLGMSIPTVHRRLTQALDMFGQPEARHYRMVIAQQYDMLLQVAMQGVEQGDLESVRAAVSILDRKAKLLGVEAPTQVEVHATVETEQERGLRDLLDQAEREAKARESAVVDGETVEA